MCSYKGRALITELVHQDTHSLSPGWFFLPAHLVGDRASIVLHSELWQRQLGLGVPRAVSMVVMTLLEESVVCGL